MPYDPVHQGQLYLRRAGQLLRGYGVQSVPEVDYARQRLEGEAHERFFNSGTMARVGSPSSYLPFASPLSRPGYPLAAGPRPSEPTSSKMR